MPDATGKLASSENNPPDTSTVVDWVQQQSRRDSHQDHPTATMPQRDQNVTPPPRPVPFDEVQFNQVRHSAYTAARQPAGRVYSIETLLRLREMQSAVPVMLRVKPEAIAENIFQYMGAATTRRLPTRSRGLSDMSGISYGSNEYNHRAAFKSAESTTANMAVRQPVAPPATTALQRNDGFFRFLKQHASPPHQRVTAGGRIVPTGPSSPPPMFDYASLNGLVRDRPPVATAGQNGGNFNTKGPYVQAAQAQPIPSMTFCGYLAGQEGRPNGQQVLLPNAIQASVPYNYVPLANQPSMAPKMPTLTTVMPLGIFPDGTSLVSFNGNNYRTYWDGLSLVMEPLGATIVSAKPRTFTAGAYPQPLLDNPQDALGDLTQAAVASVPLASASNGAPLQAFATNIQPKHQAVRNEDEMKAQLSKLDKYLALYHYDIVPEERTAFVAQRRHLIEEIDKLRARKEQTKHTIPIIEPAAEAVITAAGQPTFRYQNAATSTMVQLGAAQKPISTKTGVKGYSLSPAAPAFIPKGIQSSCSISLGAQSGKEITKQHEQGKIVEPHAGQIRTLDIMDITNAAISRKGKVLQADPTSIPTKSCKDETSSNILEASDPAMRIIEYDDIEYASRYLYSWTQDKKAYCTTVEEFQEAIRRVREQARMFGCAGGSSKDPAYDAEQDLWWAICERDPIPIPTVVPDHVTNPRPWNWNDSAFNYRHKGQSHPEPAFDHARKSSRLSGWDTTTTDSTKDTVEGFHSYFTAKDQLPSLPIHQCAYDHRGNKVQIEPEVTNHTAGFRASLYEAFMDDSSVHGRLPITEAKEAALTIPRVEPKDTQESTVTNPDGEHIELIRTSQTKSQKKKKNLTDGDALRLVSTLSADKPTKPKEDAGVGDLTASPPSTLGLSHTHASTLMSTPRPYDRLDQTYVEDNAEISRPRLFREYFKISPTPQRNISSTFLDSRVDTKLNRKNAIIAEPLEEVYQLGSEIDTDYLLSGPATSNANEKPQDIDDLWYGPALDPVTFEYLARLKTWRPGDPDVSKQFQAELEECEKDEYGFPKHLTTKPGLRNQYKDRVGRLATSRNRETSAAVGSYAPLELLGTWNSGEFSAQTRSPWGPEDDRQDFESQHSWRLTHHGTESPIHNDAETAKVGIATTSFTQSSSVREHDIGTAFDGFGDRKAREKRQVGSVDIASSREKDSYQFLRKMLKSPPFTLSRPKKAAEQISAALKNSRSKIPDATNTIKTRSVNKENTIYNGPSEFKSAPLADLSRPTFPFKHLSNISVSKGLPSSASSFVQAHEPLSLHEGVGGYHTADVGYERSKQLPRSLVRVNLPSQNAYSSACGSGQSGPDRSSRDVDNAGRHRASVDRYVPARFGFDGGSDTPAPEKNDTPTTAQHVDPRFDYKGVTTADYQKQRSEPENEWHRGQVEDFFYDLAQKEEKEMSDDKRVDGKRAV